MKNSVKYYWCSIGFTFASLILLIANCEWLCILMIILSIVSILFGHLIENGELE